ncbi:hypothetical protein J6590_068779 [Homalodisca vitripennis]|nr:hypothetical protein J6590_068779 [Homalodisca vitripennis]
MPTVVRRVKEIFHDYHETNYCQVNEVAGDSGNQSAWIYETGDLSPSPRTAFKCRVSGIITSQFVALAPRDVVTMCLQDYV